MASRVLEAVDQLEDNLDDLEEVLQPLLSQPLHEFTKKLPLLDRAKLHITVVYAIESLIFSYLKINGVDAKKHPVFEELTRVKQYFEKVKNAEDGPMQTPSKEISLDKQAALRMIKHSLAGNNKIDLERAEADARQRLLAKRKLKLLEASMKDKAAANNQSATDVFVAPAEEQEIADIVASAVDEMSSSAPSKPDDLTSPANETHSTKSKQRKKDKKRKQGEVDLNGHDENTPKKTRSEKKKKNKKEKKREQEAAAAAASLTADAG